MSVSSRSAMGSWPDSNQDQGRSFMRLPVAASLMRKNENSNQRKEKTWEEGYIVSHVS